MFSFIKRKKQSRPTLIEEAKGILKSAQRAQKAFERGVLFTNFLILMVCIKYFLDANAEDAEIRNARQNIENEYVNKRCDGAAGIWYGRPYRGNNPYCSYLYEARYDLSTDSAVGKMLITIFGSLISIATLLCQACLLHGDSRLPAKKMLTEQQLARLLEINSILKLPITSEMTIREALRLISNYENPKTPPTLQDITLDYLMTNTTRILATLPNEYKNNNKYRSGVFVSSYVFLNNLGLNGITTSRLLEPLKVLALEENLFFDKKTHQIEQKKLSTKYKQLQSANSDLKKKNRQLRRTKIRLQTKYKIAVNPSSFKNAKLFSPQDLNKHKNDVHPNEQYHKNNKNNPWS